MTGTVNSRGGVKEREKHEAKVAALADKTLKSARGKGTRLTTSSNDSVKQQKMMDDDDSPLR